MRWRDGPEQEFLTVIKAKERIVVFHIVIGEQMVQLESLYVVLYIDIGPFKASGHGIRLGAQFRRRLVGHNRTFRMFGVIFAVGHGLHDVNIVLE